MNYITKVMDDNELFKKEIKKSQKDLIATSICDKESIKQLIKILKKHYPNLQSVIDVLNHLLFFINQYNKFIVSCVFIGYHTITDNNKVSIMEEEDFKTTVEKVKNIAKFNDFYIGTTTNVEKRLEQHEKNKELSKMQVICICYGKKIAKDIEKYLILQVENYKHKLNQSGGGEGIKDGFNFIYIMTE